VQFFWLIAAVFIFDQLTKWLVYQYMELYQSVPVIHDFFYLTYVTNDGMAFGLSLPGGQWSLTILSIIMTFILVYFFWLERNSHLIIKLSLSLIISGALGNLVDRILAGEVIDFMHIKIGAYWEWYIFNIADTSVSVGMILFIIHSLYFQDKIADKATV
jgi:signal peptidase II|tara:strand:+ start:7775 stop:8251 length:477 start_codon:yes stop_codon:yes gene_type:complete